MSWEYWTYCSHGCPSASPFLLSISVENREGTANEMSSWKIEFKNEKNLGVSLCMWVPALKERIWTMSMSAASLSPLNRKELSNLRMCVS